MQPKWLLPLALVLSSGSMRAADSPSSHTLPHGFSHSLSPAAAKMRLETLHPDAHPCPVDPSYGLGPSPVYALGIRLW